MISFPTIPANIRVPLFWAEVDNSRANTAQDSGASLLFGHKLAAGSMATETLTAIQTVNQAKSFAGEGSQLARMVEAYRNVDPFGSLYCIAVPESGTAATGSVVITGTATTNGSITFYIGNRSVNVTISASFGGVDIASNAAYFINLIPDLPVVASFTYTDITSKTGTLVLTAKHKGLTGNDIPIAVNYYGIVGGEELPPGVTTKVNRMSGGTGDPDLMMSVIAMGDEKFDFIGTPFNSLQNLQYLRNEMGDTRGRWSYIRQLFGHVYTTVIGDLSTQIAATAELNDQHLTLCGYEEATQTAADELTALRVAREAVFIRNDPARPTQTGELNGALPAPVGTRWGTAEKQMLLEYGIATAYAESGTLLIERSITTYRKNKYGVTDNSYLDSETLHTLAYVLRKLKSAITSKYGRHKLANDGTRFGPGQAIVTPSVIKGEINSMYRQLERAGIVENFEAFKKMLVVERNATDPTRLDVLLPPDLVNQLRVFAVLAQFRLQYTDEEAA